MEAELSRLRITRETMDEVLSDGPGVAAPVGDVESAVLLLADLAPVLLAAEAAGNTATTSLAYRRILVAFAGAPGPLRCMDVCAAVGLGIEG